MTGPIAYMNDRFVPEHELLVPPQDLGFMWGVTVAEQLRTFGGKLFQLPEHLQRLDRSRQIVGGDNLDLETLSNAAIQVIEHNFALIDSKLDLGLTIFVTPGLSPTYAPATDDKPFVGIHSYPLPFPLWADKYESGQECEFSQVPQVSAACWPRELKARSRVHYYLADQEVKQKNPQARAILLDEDGNVNEGTTANVVAHFKDEGFVSPPMDDILPGISLRFLSSLAIECNTPVAFRKISADELIGADEILLTSTPYCLLPVSRLGNRSLKQRTYSDQLLAIWSNKVGVDIRKQAAMR